MTKEQILELTSRRIDNRLKALAERGFEIDKGDIWMQDNPEYSVVEFGAKDATNENGWYEVLIDTEENPLCDQPYYIKKLCSYPPFCEGYDLRKEGK